MSNMPDLSALFSMLSNNDSNKQISNQEDMLNNFINSSSSQNNSIPDMPDMETIMKIMKIFQSTNASSPSKELLKSFRCRCNRRY